MTPPSSSHRRRSPHGRVLETLVGAEGEDQQRHDDDDAGDADGVHDRDGLGVAAALAGEDRHLGHAGGGAAEEGGAAVDLGEPAQQKGRRRRDADHVERRRDHGGQQAGRGRQHGRGQTKADGEPDDAVGHLPAIRHRAKAQAEQGGGRAGEERPEDPGERHAQAACRIAARPADAGARARSGREGCP